ncbi:MAG: hypothetical protein E7112_00910 [Bacteroidales bacterium]|nr:hypothetical protein [Bacteroidales bacterium]
MATIKTPDQIRGYLRKQKWIHKFARNMKEVGKLSRKEVVLILSGRYGVYTVSAGFDWGTSPQGHEYWYSIHKEFERWYYNG